MKTDPIAQLPEATEHAAALAKVLGQSERLNELVKESADELSSVNAVIKQELAHGDPQPAVEDFLEKSEAVKNKVQEVSEMLTVVNKALEGEIRERVMVDYQLAAAIEQKDAADNAAFHDALTGLPNRALFNDRLEHGIAQAKRHGGTLAVMFVDLDKFKSVNDTYGHDVGDIVLQTAARRLKDNSRGDDTVSRHGGDEFLFLLTEIQNDNNIAMIAEKIIKAIAAPCNVEVRNNNISTVIGASIGISIFPKDGTTADALIKRADEAMYRSKQSQSGYSFAS